MPHELTRWCAQLLICNKEVNLHSTKTRTALSTSIAFCFALYPFSPGCLFEIIKPPTALSCSKNSWRLRLQRSSDLQKYTGAKHISISLSSNPRQATRERLKRLTQSIEDTKTHVIEQGYRMPRISMTLGGKGSAMPVCTWYHSLIPPAGQWLTVTR